MASRKPDCKAINLIRNKTFNLRVQVGRRNGWIGLEVSRSKSFVMVGVGKRDKEL